MQPESYQTVGRIADAMVYSSLLPYTFLIVGHIEASGRRENNAILSQRRADAIREILVNTFKISAKRIQSVGLGEEQLLDANPTAADWFTSRNGSIRSFEPSSISAARFMPMLLSPGELVNAGTPQR